MICGLLQPVVIRPDGYLIAGERRLRACRALGWSEIPVRVVDLENLITGEAAENFCRKDFTLSEAVAIKRALEPDLREAAMARQSAGTPVQSLHKGRTREKVAAFAGFSHETLRKAEAVVAAAEAEPGKYGKLAADMDRTGRVDGVFRRLSNTKQAEAIRAHPPPLPTGPFGVIVVDPPWPYEIGQNDPASRGIRPYPTMNVEELCRMPVSGMADADAILWLWTTNARLLDGSALRVVEAWGFEAKTLLTWAKDRIGYGAWLRSQTEQVIMAVRGRPPTTLATHSTLLTAPRGGHSEKPDAFYALVQSLCPAAPGGYCELFARRERPGWTVWGDEVPAVMVGGSGP